MNDRDPETALPPTTDTHGAPVIFFDEAPTLGHYNGIGHITLTVRLHRSGEEGAIAVEDRVCAYLRANVRGLSALKRAIEAIELIAAPAGEPGKQQAN